MDFLKNRAVAIVLAVVIVLGSTLVTSGTKLKSQCQKITDGFYSGVTYDGYEHPSIQSQLKNISRAALGLATIASNYTGVDAAAVKTDRDNLDSSLEKGTPSQIYDIYTALTADTAALVSSLRAQTLSDRDSSGVDQYESIISSASGVIDKSGYNDTVRDFLRSTYNVFPASFFASLTGVNPPELFE